MLDNILFQQIIVLTTHLPLLELRSNPPRWVWDFQSFVFNAPITLRDVLTKFGIVAHLIPFRISHIPIDFSPLMRIQGLPFQKATP